jgi:hypothetical protein
MRDTGDIEAIKDQVCKTHREKCSNDGFRRVLTLHRGPNYIPLSSSDRNYREEPDKWAIRKFSIKEKKLTFAVYPVKSSGYTAKSLHYFTANLRHI